MFRKKLLQTLAEYPPARKRRIVLAQETVRIIGEGGYDVGGKRVNVALRRDAAGLTVHALPAGAALQDLQTNAKYSATYELEEESTLTAARRLVDRGLNVCALNFASAKRPCGKFLKGIDAQEEDNATNTLLYAALSDESVSKHFSDAPRNHSLYTDDMLHAPHVPVIRNDAGDLLEEPWPLSFLSAASPNANAARRAGCGENEIATLYERRADRVLHHLASFGYDALVLGKWGLEYQNDALMAAQTWADLLKGKYAGFFKCVALPLAGKEEERMAFEVVFGIRKLAAVVEAPPAGFAGDLKKRRRHGHAGWITLA
ncbi:hypothetical protein M885DRAFT_522274 [Pelagophyceae sp. CCMP2097]|nr:hypothetical protein M885DRAFT_522274 [Pelagophyceae sp. CCMP2097]